MVWGWGQGHTLVFLSTTVLRVALRRVGVMLLFLVDLGVGEQPADHGTVVLDPRRRSDGTHLRVRRVRLAQDLCADVQLGRHGAAPAKGGRHALHEVGPLAPGPLLNLKDAAIAAETLPVLVDVGYRDGDIAEPVVGIGPVLVVQAALEGEAGGGDVGDYPLLLPAGFRRLADGPGPVGERGVLLVAPGHVGDEGRVNEGVGRLRLDVGDGQVPGLVDGELDRVPGRRIGERGWVEAAGRTGLALYLFLLVGQLLLLNVKEVVHVAWAPGLGMRRLIGPRAGFGGHGGRRGGTGSGAGLGRNALGSGGAVECRSHAGHDARCHLRRRSWLWIASGGFHAASSEVVASVWTSRGAALSISALCCVHSRDMGRDWWFGGSNGIRSKNAWENKSNKPRRLRCDQEVIIPQRTMFRVPRLKGPRPSALPRAKLLLFVHFRQISDVIVIPMSAPGPSRRSRTGPQPDGFHPRT